MEDGCTTMLYCSQKLISDMEIFDILNWNNDVGNVIVRADWLINNKGCAICYPLSENSNSSLLQTLHSKLFAPSNIVHNWLALEW